MNNTSYKHCLIFLFMHVLFKVNAQVNLQIHKVLHTAFSETQVKFYEEKAKQLNQLDYKIPLVEEVEVRSETNDFDPRKQDFVVRVSTNNRAKRRAYQLYHESVQHMTEMENESEILRALTERYGLIIDYVYTQEIINVQSKIYRIAKDKVKLLKRMVALSSFDIVELIQAEDDVYRIQRQLLNYENKMANLRAEIEQLTGESDIEIFKKEILRVQDIKELMTEISAERKTHPEIEIMSARHYNAMMEHEWEDSKSKFSLGFIQAKYGHDPENGFEENFSLGVGFNFPLKGSSRLDLNEKKISILDTQSKYLSIKQEFNHAENENLMQLNRMIQMHELLSKQINEGNAEYALNEYSKQSIATPISLIKLKELNVSNEMLLLEIEEEITISYLQYLYSSGIIGNKPYRNFLYRSLPNL